MEVISRNESTQSMEFILFAVNIAVFVKVVVFTPRRGVLKGPVFLILNVVM